MNENNDTIVYELPSADTSFMAKANCENFIQDLRNLMEKYGVVYRKNTNHKIKVNCFTKDKKKYGLGLKYTQRTAR